MRVKDKAAKVQRAPLAAHPAFRLILVTWLAALTGLATLVLTSHPLKAGCAAVGGAVLGWLFARLATRHSGRASVPAVPESEQGLIEPQPEPLPDRPVFLDVSELGFAGLDAEMIADEPDAEPEFVTDIGNSDRVEDCGEPLDPQPGKSAAAVLKAQPIDQMSMVQMIERFAHALDQRREGNGPHSKVRKLPSPALIEALRTLPGVNPPPVRHYATHGNAALAVSTAQQAEETERALREALEKLQRMSGGA